MPKQEDTPHRTEDYQRRLEHLRKMLEPVPGRAIEFGLEPIDVAGTFLAVGVTVLQKTLGKEKSVDYLVDLANLQQSGELPESAKPTKAH